MTAILLLLGIIIIGYCLFNMTFNGLLILGLALFFWGFYRVKGGQIMKIPYVPHELIETSPWRLIMNDNLTYTMYRVDNPTVEWVFKEHTTLFKFIADNQIDLQVGDIIVDKRTHQRLGQPSKNENAEGL